MSENKRRSEAEKLDFIRHWSSGDRVPAVYRESPLVTVVDIYYHDRRAHNHSTYISSKEFATRVVSIFITAAITGIGIGQLIYEFFGK